MSYREEPGYIDNLLAIRGLCALGVALVHLLGAGELSLRSYVDQAWEFAETSRSIVSAMLPMTGKNFVLFFFVHSGYLIGKVFFMDRYPVNREGIKRFYRGRFLRIAPLLYVNLIVCLLFLPSANPTFLEALGDFLFINNFTGRGINGVTWSLSWEMQYYLIAPFVFAYFRIPAQKILIQILALAILFQVLAGFGIKEFPPTEYLFYFLLGFSVNIVLRSYDGHKFLGSTAIAVVGGFFLSTGVYYVLFNSGFEAIANPFIGVCAALTIYLLELPRADESQPPLYERYGVLRLLTLRFWTWMGILSYGVYLWHLPILIVGHSFTAELAQMFIGNWEGIESGWQRMLIFHAIQLPVILGVTLLVSLVTFIFVEIRFRPHLYRWDNSRYLFRHLAFLAPKKKVRGVKSQ